MDNFDFKKYLAEGRIHKDFDQINEKKKTRKKVIRKNKTP